MDFVGGLEASTDEKREMSDPGGSALNSNVTVQIVGPNNYASFDVIQITVGAGAQSTGYYDWTAPTQTGTYTVTISLLPPTRSALDSETIQVT